VSVTAWYSSNRNTFFLNDLFCLLYIPKSPTEKMRQCKGNIPDTGWSKSHVTHSWHMFYLSKNKLHWNCKKKKKKQCYIKCWKCPPRSLSSLKGRPERLLSCALPVSRKRFTRRDTVDLFGTGNREMYP
jgi:hypothetical protein